MTARIAQKLLERARKRRDLLAIATLETWLANRMPVWR